MRKRLSKKITAWSLSCALLAGLTSAAGVPVVHAEENDVIKAGDTVKLGVASEKFAGSPEWTVVETMDDDKDGTPDRAYLLSKYVWKDAREGANANGSIKYSDQYGAADWNVSKAKNGVRISM